MFKWWSDANPFNIPLLLCLTILAARRFAQHLPPAAAAMSRRVQGRRLILARGLAVVSIVGWIFFETYFRVMSCRVSQDYHAATLALAGEVMDVLDSNGIEYWMDFATLLSVLRNQTINAWDHDADVSIVKPAGGHHEVQRALAHAGLHSSYDARDLVQIVRRTGDSTIKMPHIDIWLWTEVKDEHGHAIVTPDPESPAPRRPWAAMFPLKRVPWAGYPGKPTPIPADAHKISHMEFDRFGGDYMVAQVFRGDCFHNFFNGRWYWRAGA